MIVLVTSPTSAVSPPADRMLIPYFSSLQEILQRHFIYFSDHLSSEQDFYSCHGGWYQDIICSSYTEEIIEVSLPSASCAMPFHTERSPVSFHIIKQRRFCTGTSACITTQCGLSLRKDRGLFCKRQREILLYHFFIAMRTSSFESGNASLKLISCWIHGRYKKNIPTNLSGYFVKEYVLNLFSGFFPFLSFGAGVQLELLQVRGLLFVLPQALVVQWVLVHLDHFLHLPQCFALLWSQAPISAFPVGT